MLLDQNSDALSITFTIQKNQHDFFREIVNLRNEIISENGDIHYIFADGVPISQILRIITTTENKEHVLTSLVNGIREGILPNHLVFSPYSTPNFSLSDIESHGFINLKENNTSAMAIFLNNLPVNLVKPTGFEIIDVDDNNLIDWTRAVGLSLFRLTEEQVPITCERLRPYLHLPNSRLFLGMYNGLAVAASSLYLSSGVAGIYHVGVLPQYQNMGFGKAITIAPLLYARELGYKIAILQATESGQRIYEKIGFKEYTSLLKFKLDI